LRLCLIREIGIRRIMVEHITRESLSILIRKL
jgi:hypothetical protein